MMIWRDMMWHDVTWRDMKWYDVSWRDMTWNDVAWRDLTWHYVTLRDMTWHDVTWRDMTKRDLAWREMTWNGVTWRGRTWHDVTWCEMMWHDVTLRDITWHDNNPRTAELFQLTFAAKEGCCNPPLGFWSSRPNFIVKFFMGIVSGSRNPKVIVRIFYLYHVTLNIKVIDLERERWNIVHDFHFQGHGVAPRHLFIDFRTPWPKKT